MLTINTDILDGTDAQPVTKITERIIRPNTPALIFDLDDEFSVFTGDELVIDTFATDSDDPAVRLLGTIADVLNRASNDPIAGDFIIASLAGVVTNFTHFVFE